MTFAERLIGTRERYGWSARLLAKQADVPYETIYRTEHGTHHAPRLDIVIKLADALGVSIDYLTGRTDEPQVAPLHRPRPAPLLPTRAVRAARRGRAE